ncbi:hypothetical protein ASF45_34020 [Pseudorhodoferax sp. Leaf265]|nr:hypothetical protein ASF45_34020 [Pseudorhodoferax sp. Leaf265]
MNADALANPTIENIAIRLKAPSAEPHPNAGLILVVSFLGTYLALGLRIVEQFEPLGVNLQDPFDLEWLVIKGFKQVQHIIHGAVGCHAV